MYTRGFSTLGCAEWSLPQVAALAAQHGGAAIELRALGGTLDLPEYFARHYGTPDALVAEVRGAGAHVPVIDTGFRLIGGGASDRDALLGILPWAEKLGVRWLRVFDGGTEFTASAIADAANTMAWWRQLRSERGLQVDLMVETHDVLLNSERVLTFLNALPGASMPVLWDAHHTWKKGGEDPLVTWTALRSHIAHVHVKDSVNIPRTETPYTYILPGTGEFPMAALKKALTAEYNGVVSLEWEKWWHPYLGSLDAALTSAAEHRWW